MVRYTCLAMGFWILFLFGVIELWRVGKGRDVRVGVRGCENLESRKDEMKNRKNIRKNNDNDNNKIRSSDEAWLTKPLLRQVGGRAQEQLLVGIEGGETKTLNNIQCRGFSMSLRGAKYLETRGTGNINIQRLTSKVGKFST